MKMFCEFMKIRVFRIFFEVGLNYFFMNVIGIILLYIFVALNTFSHL